MMRAHCALVAMTLLVLAAIPPAAGQQTDEPVGWPLRPEKPKYALPMPVEPEPRPAAPADPQGSDPPPSAELRPDVEIAPIDRFLLPIKPLAFDYAADRTALTREEANQLSRLAQRLRGAEDRIAITAYAVAEARTAKEALTLSLARALTIRDFLVREGVSVDQIDVTALPRGKEGAGQDHVDIEKAPTQNAAGRR